MSDTFSAGPQAVGYLYQARYALLALLQTHQEEASVVVEGLDDIELRDSNGPITLDQLKHHLKGAAALTDSSSDLWRTLRIWSTQLADKAWDPTVVKLSLITTATAPEETAAWYLRAGSGRNIDRALELLIKVTEESTSKNPAMRQAFAAFKRLPDLDQKQLLYAITIVDNAHHIEDVPELIKQQLRFAVPPSVTLQEQLQEQLEGWWFAKIVEHLVNSSRDPITRLAVHRKIWSLANQLHEDNLPIDYANAVPDYVVDPTGDNRTFVRQLHAIEINADRVKRAILDYYRAYTQRSSWVRNQLIIDDDLEVYERKLVDAWDTMKDALRDEILSEDVQEAECIELGRRLLRWAETEVNIRIRPQVEERFVIRGSYHILANASPPRVYWHPKFMERLEEILSL